MTINTYSPVIEQYLSIKSQYPNAILLYRMGDFYEMFFEDAKKASKILDIALTKKINKNKEIPMAGVPYHTINVYIKKIVSLGIHVAICEQTGSYDKKKKLMNRKVIKIITPGTITDLDLLNHYQSNFILSITEINKNYYCAYADIMNGDFNVFFCSDKESLDLKLFKIQPTEVITYQNSIVEIINNNKIITKRSSWEFEQDFALSKIINHFKINYNYMFKNEKYKICLRSAGALLSYLEHTQCKELDHVKIINVERNDDYLNLDAVTIKNLELVKSINNEKTNSLLSLLDTCKTNMGSRLLHRWIINPILNKNTLRNRYKAINDLKKNDNYIYINNILSNIKDTERIMSRISLMNATPKELIKLKKSISFIPLLKKKIRNINNVYLNSLDNNILEHNEVFLLLEKSLLTDVKPGIKYGSIIKYGCNEELDLLKNITEQNNNKIINLEKDERFKTGINNLKIKFNKMQGFYIEISRSKLQLVPSNYIKKQTLKNVERFTIPELISIELDILKKKDRVAEIEKYLYNSILSFLKENIKKIQNTNKYISELDVINTLCERSIYCNLVEPILVNKKCIKIKQSFHPVVVNARLKEFILNDIYFDNRNKLFIITGPNMGGKSTYMRQLALTVILSHIGSFVPAKQAIIGNIDGIFTRIGSSDNITLNQSTFMTEMLETSYIVKNSTPNSLILLDEIGRGTSVFDGMSIAWATAIKLYMKGSYTLFATHYFEMTKLSNILNYCGNLYTTARVHNEKLFLMYKIKKGSVDQSYGIHIAKLAGMETDLINIAEKKLLSIKKENKRILSLKKNNKFKIKNFLYRLINSYRNNKEYIKILYFIRYILYKL